MTRWISKNGKDCLFWGCFVASIVFVFCGLNNPEMQNNYILAAVICGAFAALIFVGEAPES